MDRAPKKIRTYRLLARLSWVASLVTACCGFIFLLTEKENRLDLLLAVWTWGFLLIFLALHWWATEMERGWVDTVLVRSSTPSPQSSWRHADSAVPHQLEPEEDVRVTRRYGQ